MLAAEDFARLPPDTRAVLLPIFGIAPPLPPAAAAPVPELPLIDDATGLMNITRAQARLIANARMKPRPRALYEVFVRRNHHSLSDTVVIPVVGADRRGGIGSGVLSSITERGRRLARQDTRVDTSGRDIDLIHYRRGTLSFSPATHARLVEAFAAQGVVPDSHGAGAR
jgi:hypothetical protein